MKTDPKHTFGISEITNLKHCESLVLAVATLYLQYIVASVI